MEQLTNSQVSLSQRDSLYEEFIKPNLDSETLEFGELLCSDDTLGSMGFRWLLCQTGKAFMIAERKDNPDIKKLVRMTCDSRFCKCGPCVTRRKARRIKAYRNPIKKLFNLDPKSHKNLRGGELTSPLKPTVENINILHDFIVQFLDSDKRIFSYIFQIHVDQSRLHAHILFYGYPLGSRRTIRKVTDKWTKLTGWKNTNFKQIKGGLKAHLGHLINYLVNPIRDKPLNSQSIQFIKALYRKRLFFSKGIKPDKIPESDWIVYPELVCSEATLILITRINSIQRSLKNFLDVVDYG